MGLSDAIQIEQGLVEMTPRQRAAANARAHRKPGFTPEGLERLQAAALENKPWTRSTGPTSTAGKARSSRNAWKGGHRARLDLARMKRMDIADWLRSIDAEAARLDVQSAFTQMRLSPLAVDASDEAGNDIGNGADMPPQAGMKIDDLGSSHGRRRTLLA